VVWTNADGGAWGPPSGPVRRPCPPPPRVPTPTRPPPPGECPVVRAATPRDPGERAPVV
jgi:hypothetical protein